MHTTTKLGTIVVISLLLGGCSFFGGDGSDTAASVSASAAASPVFQAKEVSPITAAELDKPQTDPGLNVEITLQAAGYNPAGSGSVIYVLVKNLNEASLPTDALTVHLERGAEHLAARTPPHRLIGATTLRPLTVLPTACAVVCFAKPLFNETHD